MNHLKGFKILDLTVRLPGPLASHYLALLGAEVIKAEDENSRDPFLNLTIGEDNLFSLWYEKINFYKKIIIFDKKNKAQELDKLIDWADVILHSYSKDEETLFFKNNERKKTYLKLAASRDEKVMHDLNALARAHVLELYLKHHEDNKTPFLPIGGIAFANQIALHVLAAEYSKGKNPRAIHEVCYLLDAVHSVFDVFVEAQMQSQEHFPHLPQGAYPCYQIYVNKSGDYVALAAIEEKYWLMCQNELGLDLPLEDRFSRDLSAYSRVAQVFANLTTEEIEEKIKNKHLCLSIVRLKSGK